MEGYHWMKVESIFGESANSGVSAPGNFLIAGDGAADGPGR
jgi:hypothetical protein